MLASLYANVNRDRKKHPEAFTPRDFMPEVPMTAEEKQRDLMARISAAMMSLGGKVRDGGA